MTIPQARRRPRAASIRLAAPLALVLAGCGAAVSGDGGGGDSGTTSDAGPVITTPPASQTVDAGQTATFTVVATGTAPLTYRWKKGTTEVGGNSATLTLTNVQTSDAGDYIVTVSNVVGSVTSDGATLTVSAASSKPVISSFTASPTFIASGGSSTLSWAITGATSASIAGTSVDADSGTVTVTPTTTTTYTLTASNAAGSAAATTAVTVGASASPGWLYTKAPGTAGSNKIYVNDGSGEKVWMGRGVNTDDLFLGCYNDSLWMGTDAETELYDSISSLVTGWKANFIRMSMMMWGSCNKNVSWLTGTSDYRDPMVRVVNELTSAYPNLYVMLTVRTDSTMTDCDIDPDATCVPTTATHAVYEAMVDSFADNPQVMFGLSNEPGAWSYDGATMAAIMSGAVDAIRGEEDKLGASHHIVAVQGTSYTSALGYYSKNPLSQENVVYEYHNYPPEPTGDYGYTYSNIPVIIGEYAGLNFVALTQSQANTLYADWETKQIPNLGWYFSPFSAVAPAMLSITADGSRIQPNNWGTIVKSYLTSHAQ